MAYDIRQYIDSLKQDPFWVGRIANDINKLLLNPEYIDSFIQIYIKWSSDNSIECLPNFEKIALSQFKVYIESEKMTQCFVCDNCNMSIFIQSSNVKEGVFCILQMLRIHTGLKNLIRRINFIYFFATRIHWGSNNHVLLFQIMRCCLNIIELLLSWTKMQLILKRRMKSSVTEYFMIS